MTDFADGKIQAFVGPEELGAPDNLEAEIVNFIGGAKQSLDIAVQELDSEPIAQAILEARWRGVSQKDFPGSRPELANPKLMRSGGDSGRSIAAHGKSRQTAISSLLSFVTPLMSERI